MPCQHPNRQGKGGPAARPPRPPPLCSRRIAGTPHHRHFAADLMASSRPGRGQRWCGMRTALGCFKSGGHHWYTKRGHWQARQRPDVKWDAHALAHAPSGPFKSGGHYWYITGAIRAEPGPCTVRSGRPLVSCNQVAQLPHHWCIAVAPRPSCPGPFPLPLG